MINIHIKPEHYMNALKILVIVSLFFFIRRLNISENYKFLLMIVPTLLILTTRQVFDHFTYKDRPKPIVVRKDDTMTDKYMPEEFFYEPFTIETLPTNNAMIYELEKPYWIQKGGFLDISNPNNFVKIDNLKLNTNYTIEFWFRLKQVSNNNILLFKNGSKKLLEMNYDDKFIVINEKNKIPYKENEWMHLVIMRGSLDTIGNSKGSMYVNGIFHGYLENLPDLYSLKEAYLFKFTGEMIDYNKNYNDLSNCSVVRIYDRSLTLDEIQNNYLKDASYYALENEDSTGRIFVQDKSLVFYLEARTDSIPVEEHIIKNEKPKQFAVKNKPRKLYADPKKMNDIPIEKEPADKTILLDLTDTSITSDDWLEKANKKIVNKQAKLVEKEKNKVKQVEQEEEKAPMDYLLKANWISIEPNKVEERKNMNGKIIRKQPKGPKEETKTKTSQTTTKPIF